MADKFLGFLGDLVEPANGGGGNYVYYSGTSNDFGEEITVASVIKYSTPENVSFMTNPFSDLPFDSIVGVGFDKSLKISHPFTGELTTVGDFLAELGVDWTQITEEEFYDTNLGAGNGGKPE